MATVVAAPEQQVDERNPVDTMMDEVVRRFTRSGGEITVRGEAESIVAWLERRQPEVLIEWFSDHMIAVLSQQLQIRLAGARRKSRSASVFEPDDPEAAEELVTSPFARPYACPEGRWKPLGDMLRPDWQHVIEDRGMRARASLFEVELAKRLVAKLPDDDTPTRCVVTEAELEGLEDQARTKSARTVARIERP